MQLQWEDEGDPRDNHITPLISPLAGQTSSHVKNSRHFTEMMKNMHVKNDEILLSSDVSSLFTNVPVGKAVSVICESLEKMRYWGTGHFSPQDISLPRTDVPEIHLLQLRKFLWVEGRCSYGLPSPYCGGQTLHGVL